MDNNLEKIQTNVEKYVEYAQNLIEEYQEARNLTDNRNITPDQINYNLAVYLKVSDILIDEYEKAQLEYNNQKEDFQIWWDEHYIKIRERLNPLDLTAQKWAGKEEIASYVRNENKDQYMEFKSELLLSERKVSKLKRICDSYKNFSYLLTTLSDNMKIQMNNLHLESRMNKPITRQIKNEN
jgi:hypothetical protein